MKTKLQTLETLLQSHDWFYQHSDDNSVYEQGRFEWFMITKVMKSLNNSGFSEQSSALYEKYLPEPLKY